MAKQYMFDFSHFFSNHPVYGPVHGWSISPDEQLYNLKFRSRIFGFHGCDCEECRLLGCGAVWIYYKLTFQRNVSSPSSGWKKNVSEEKC
jgi:hypothetical protein